MTDTITLPRSVVEQALEALDHASMPYGRDWALHGEARLALRSALEQPQVEQEPLADEQWLKRWTGRTGRRLKPGPERDRLLRIFRFAERAHDIGG